jgi:trk system potassium uptake protein TrkH
MIFKSLGIVLVVEAVCMIPSLLVSAIYHDKDFMALIYSILVCFLCGILMYQIKAENKNFYARDGFTFVALSWITVSFFGALPFVFSGAIPSLTDAFFETSSGFTTTGSTILKQIEGMPRGVLFWRHFIIWMGGMGVLVLTLAVLPSVGASFFHVMKAESTGPSTEKLVPKLGQTAKILYTIYIVMTAILTAALLFAGMPLYDALVHAFSTAGTGGFSSRNLSIGAYNNVSIEVIIAIFMFLFGINFSLYFQIIKGNIRGFFKNQEFRFYLGTVIIAILLITTDLYMNGLLSLGQSIRYSSFQVSSMITTTGFSTTDYNLWSVFSKIILVVIMFIGSSAGSTAGGIKCIRFVLLFKIVKREIMNIIHPRAVHTVRIDGKAVDDSVLSGVMAFFFLYIILFASAAVLLSLNGFDLVTTVTSVTAAISNVGPGLGEVGPMGNYSAYSGLSKILLSFCMIAGRLEIYPMLVLFSPYSFKKVGSL